VRGKVDAVLFVQRCGRRKKGGKRGGGTRLFSEIARSRWEKKGGQSTGECLACQVGQSRGKGGKDEGKGGRLELPSACFIHSKGGGPRWSVLTMSSMPDKRVPVQESSGEVTCASTAQGRGEGGVSLVLPSPTSKNTRSAIICPTGNGKEKEFFILWTSRQQAPLRKVGTPSSHGEQRRRSPRKFSSLRRKERLFSHYFSHLRGGWVPLLLLPL